MADNTTTTHLMETQPAIATAHVSLRMAAPKVVLRLPDVQHRTGLSRATIYRKMNSEEFPRARQLSANSVGWLESDIEAWIESRVATGGVR